MKKKSKPGNTLQKYIFAFSSLLIALVIVYSNSFNGTWHFDDYANIVNNPNVHLTSLSWKDIKTAAQGIDKYHGFWGRPVVYFTFGFNYYAGGTRVFGYHAVNFTIHYLSAIFLFMFLYSTLRLTNTDEFYRKQTYAISLLSTFLWATHPVQVTSVTYIVQRMTSMAGMFYILSMLLYVTARIETAFKKSLLVYILCGIAAVLSIACKQNAAMLPVSILLFELFIIQGTRPENHKNNQKQIITAIIALGAAGLFFVYYFDILSGYAIRPFTLYERLLTEPRVIFFYMYQLLYPVSSNFTFLHDVEISRSVFLPWNTLPAIASILLITVISIKIRGRAPVFAFCIIFFFINHLIESSFLPLEIIFEHRNYIPSMLFFVLPASAMVFLMDYFSYKKTVHYLLLTTIIIFLSAQGHTTYMRNIVFKDSILFWNDNVKKAPGLNRTHHELGRALFLAGFYNQSLSEMKKALSGRSSARIDQKYRSHFNLGSFYLFMDDQDKALEQFFKSLEFRPDNPSAINAIGVIFIKKNQLNLAEQYLRKAVSLKPDSPEFKNNLNDVLNKINARKIPDR